MTILSIASVKLWASGEVITEVKGITDIGQHFTVYIK